ncbi:MAG: hypothetical protein J2P19_00010 [Pseudonocardia sp.]|nr:hypothetical protein [Pseudonocardia sp.]
MINAGLLDAADREPSKAEELVKLLQRDVLLVHQEPATRVWLAFSRSLSEFGIRTVFAEDVGREARLEQVDMVAAEFPCHHGR